MLSISGDAVHSGNNNCNNNCNNDSVFPPAGYNSISQFPYTSNDSPTTSVNTTDSGTYIPTGTDSDVMNSQKCLSPGSPKLTSRRTEVISDAESVHSVDDNEADVPTEKLQSMCSKVGEAIIFILKGIVFIIILVGGILSAGFISSTPAMFFYD